MKGCTDRVQSLHFRNINFDAMFPEDTTQRRHLLASFEHLSKSARASLPLFSEGANVTSVRFY
jgi:hypothetical protein